LKTRTETKYGNIRYLNRSVKKYRLIGSKIHSWLTRFDARGSADIAGKPFRQIGYWRQKVGIKHNIFNISE